MGRPENNENNQEAQNQNPPRKPGVGKIMQSILAGAFGVQSDKRRQEDFSSHSPVPYIVAGLLFTAIFVVSLIIIVKLVLASQ
ncbi:DUF2970 domain-containing protein [Marinobacter persicus]|uniref:DUF2970 family protein n=1 Tax=Marinobacter persicus TaxID=930118 RepID=A0A2S6G594_9GAMM|nr:DUF2970 domain-containing protein [Marinobacter persicus]PPK50986.1 Protein of unknown function (DUF2970) [Marinobacter persicus]PPK54287.1 Protein of unknown function (DUF2970) [Marinobacter persicus]PPK57504.1 Protein of unknown function (DUF2970) [Marinobacter persicus]